MTITPELRRFEEHVREAIRLCRPDLLEQAVAWQWKQRYQQLINQSQLQESVVQKPS